MNSQATTVTVTEAMHALALNDNHHMGQGLQVVTAAMHVLALYDETEHACQACINAQYPEGCEFTFDPNDCCQLCEMTVCRGSSITYNGRLMCRECGIAEFGENWTSHAGP